MNLLRKLLVVVAGSVLLIAGLAMLVLPGPAILVIPAALSLLAFEFPWAQRMLSWMRARFKALGAPAAAKWCKHKS